MGRATQRMVPSSPSSCPPPPPPTHPPSVFLSTPCLVSLPCTPSDPDLSMEKTTLGSGMRGP